MSKSASLRIGDRVVVAGRVYRVRGFTPMSVQPARVVLEDLQSGRSFEMRAAELETDEPRRAAQPRA